MAVDLTRFINEPEEPTNNNPLFADLVSQPEELTPAETYTVAPDPNLGCVLRLL